MESEVVKELGKESDIDRSFYENLINDAIENISQYGDFEWFVSNDPYISPKRENWLYPTNEEDEMPFDDFE